jgi:hypothetical protein
VCVGVPTRFSPVRKYVHVSSLLGLVSAAGAQVQLGVRTTFSPVRSEVDVSSRASPKSIILTDRMRSGLWRSSCALCVAPLDAESVLLCARSLPPFLRMIRMFAGLRSR